MPVREEQLVTKVVTAFIENSISKNVSGCIASLAQSHPPLWMGANLHEPFTSVEDARYFLGRDFAANADHYSFL